jgi:hypothetical protein
MTKASPSESPAGRGDGSLFSGSNTKTDVVVDDDSSRRLSPVISHRRSSPRSPAISHRHSPAFTATRTSAKQQRPGTDSYDDQHTSTSGSVPPKLSSPTRTFSSPAADTGAVVSAVLDVRPAGFGHRLEISPEKSSKRQQRTEATPPATPTTTASSSATANPTTLRSEHHHHRPVRTADGAADGTDGTPRRRRV